jgi:ribosome maturation factor RimP
MDRTELIKVLEAAAAGRGCSVAVLDFDEDDNVIDVTITKEDGPVNLGDCEYVHRAVLAAFDRDVEDYALTVGSAGISGAEADALLKEMEDKD